MPLLHDGPGATSDSEYDSGYDPSQASTLSQSHLRRPDRRARPAVESLFVRLVERFRSSFPSVGRLSSKQCLVNMDLFHLLSSDLIPNCFRRT